MKKPDKNILVIGDLTTANNYGAIATTEALKKIFFETYGSSVKYIDYRSFIKPTPTSGWDTELNNSFLAKAYKIIKPYDKNGVVLKIGLEIINKQTDIENRVDIPYLFKYYEIFAHRILKGEILQYEYELLKWADAIYINGEGNIVNGTDSKGVYRIGALYILFLAYFIKKHLNKYCAIINHTVDPNNLDAAEIVKNVYPLLDYVAVREPYSIKNLNELGFYNVELVPDALFTFVPEENIWHPPEILKKEIDFTKPYICIGDSSGIRSRTTKVKWDVCEMYSKLIKELKNITDQIVFVDGFNGGHESINRLVKENKIGRVNLNNCSYKDLYHVLSKSEIFISGRWHASILCVLSGTPILLWSADSHKTKGLYSLLEYPYRFFQIDTLPLHIDDIINQTKEILENKKTISDEITKRVYVLQEEAKKGSVPKVL
ncbi:MAG: polysaccharide pyruvyl transferase family protein [Euryarchaeota archaeon]|nr:polysaccharide pyruvyl transferase family protein [Euryarchaeota archaeon]